jgi:hypothetical protein
MSEAESCAAQKGSAMSVTADAARVRIDTIFGYDGCLTGESCNVQCGELRVAMFC